MASTVSLRSASCCMSSGFCAGQMKLTSVLPGFISAISSEVGARTLKMMSALAQQLRGTACDPGAGRLVGIVAEVGGGTGPGLYADREAQLDQFLDDVGDCGNTLLARKGLARHSDR